MHVNFISIRPEKASATLVDSRSNARNICLIGICSLSSDDNTTSDYDNADADASHKNANASSEKEQILHDLGPLSSGTGG